MEPMLNVEIDDRGVATVQIDRPQVHNAFNAELISELNSCFRQLAEQRVRVMILTGTGASFSAGADLNWMRGMAQASENDNRADAARLASLLRRLDEMPCPTIARINGPAFGGGVGLIACCDISIAVNEARMGLTEVRLGLAPATIAPFVIGRIGIGAARRYMLTGERFDSSLACRLGLVSEVVAAETLDERVAEVVKMLLAGGPRALDQCKRLIRMVRESAHERERLDDRTADLIAALRVSKEGQEGLNAFLEKRKPSWIQRKTGSGKREEG